MENKQDETTMKDRIIGLLQKGYKRGQLISDFGFAERTVDAAIRAYRELNNDDAEGTGDGGKSNADDGASAGSSKSRSNGTTGSPGRGGALAIRKEKESVLPEWLGKDVAELFDGEARDQRVFLAGMSVPLMGLRLFTEAVSPIVDLLTVWQRGQAEAARAAQGSSLEVAQAAGEAAASGVGKFFMDTKPWLSASPNPWQAMMADTMRPVLQQTIGQMMGKLMGLFSQGKPNLQPAAPTGMPGESGSKLPPIRGGRRQPGGIQEATDDEIREVFGDD